VLKAKPVSSINKVARVADADSETGNLRRQLSRL